MSSSLLGVPALVRVWSCLVIVVAGLLALAGSALVAPAAYAAEVGLDPTFTTTPSFGVDLPVTVEFHANGTTTTGAAMTYTFDFGDNTPAVTSSSPDVQHTYTAAGSYLVTHTVKRGSGTLRQTKTLTFRTGPASPLPYCNNGAPYTNTTRSPGCSVKRVGATELFRVPGAGSGTKQITFVKFAHGAGNPNGLAAYVVDDDQGTVDGVAPGASGYIAAAKRRATTLIAPTTSASTGGRDSSTPTQSSVALPVNARVAFLLLPDPKTPDAVSLSTIAAANSSRTSPALAYLGDSTVRAGGANQGTLQLAFEDLPDGGDADFDDGVYFVIPTGSWPNAVPSLVPYAGNSVPLAAPSSTSTDFQKNIAVTLSATDADEDALTYETTAPAHGTLTGSGANLTYTPEAGFSGSDLFTFVASDGRGTSTPATVSLTVRRQAPTVTITAADLGPAKVDKRYSVQLTSSGGAATWSLADGSLPAGLTLSDDGLLSGSPTEAGTTAFALAVTNDGGSDRLDVPAFEVVAKDVAPRIVTEQTDLDIAKVDKPYSVQLAAEGTAPQWSLAGGTLPDGLTLTRSGLLSGTPTTEGAATFTLKAENDTAADTRDITITVAPKDLPPNLESATLDAAVVGKPYRSALTATGRPKPTWSITAGALPDGLTLGPDGVVSGTPTTEGTSTFSATATNAAGQVSTDLTLVVRTLPSITTTSLPAGADGAPYAAKLTATGTGPISWAVSAGALPAGFLLDPESGAISGAPTAPSDTSFTVTATNAAGAATRELRLVVKAVAPTITTTTLPPASTGSSYSATLEASGTSPVVWSLVSGSLPQGTSLSPLGVLSGTPLASGSFPVTVQASNSAGAATQKLTVVSAVPRVPAIIAPQKPLSPVVGVPYSTFVQAAGQGIITYSVASGALPTGLVLNRTTGAITGIPLRTETATFTIVATNANGTDRKAFVLSTVKAGPCTTGTCVDLIKGAPYTGRLPDSTDGISFTITGGTLPPGLTMDPTTGLINGTPTTAGTSTVTVKIATRKLSLTTRMTIVVHAPPTVSTVQTPTGTVGTTYTGAVTATGDPRLTYTVTSGALPQGLSLDRTTGRITGTPRTAGTSTATVTMTNDWGSTTAPLTITVSKR